MPRKPTYLDLFAGAGGLSEGFFRNGYIDIAHVEMNENACETLKTRAAYHYLKNNNLMDEYYKYLRGAYSKDELYKLVPDIAFESIINHEIKEDTMNDLYSKIDYVRHQKNIRKIDVIIGGPPCQAYSLVGRARSDDNMESDPRNTLYIRYCEILRHYMPKIFVFENVQGLYSANNGDYYKDLLTRLDDIGYQVEDKLMEFSDYGVLQNRKRVIIIGWLKDSKFFYPNFLKIDKTHFVNEVFDDLPILQPGMSSQVYRINNINSYLIDYKIRNANDVLTCNAARNLNAHDALIYAAAINLWTAENKRLKYTDLPQNLWTHNNRNCFLDRFKVVADNLHYSQTVVAHLSKDGHYFIHPDINQCRSITVREAARLQGFPDDYFFEGNRTSQFVQVGNAVPPIISEMIAKALLKEF